MKKSLFALLQDMEDAGNECTKLGKLIDEMLVEVAPDILSGNSPFEGSDVECLLEVMNRPENEKSLGWGITESKFLPTLKKLLRECVENEDGKIAKMIIEKYGLDEYLDANTIDN